MDNLKGICILLVVFCHYTLLSGSSVVGNAIMTLAWAAVPCFMMITGDCCAGRSLILIGRNI